jgi:FixJ family two-component response regulator
MKKAPVAILEDDSSFAQALSEALSRNGFEPHFFNSEDALLEGLKAHNFVALVVDCFLPFGSGVELSQEVRKKYPASTLEIVLMSGMFKDAAFIKEATKLTSAKHFFKKPFELSVLIEALKQTSTPVEMTEDVVPARERLYYLLSDQAFTKREKKKAIEELDEISGFDLPLIYLTLMEIKISGFLNLVNSKGEISGVYFSKGQIVNIDLAGASSKVGQILIESGFITKDDLTLGLNLKSDRKLGEKLIESHLVSPHGFYRSLRQQTLFRILQTINEETYQVNFVPDDVGAAPSALEHNQLLEVLAQNSESKLSESWLSALYTQWLTGTLRFDNRESFHSTMEQIGAADYSGELEAFINTKETSLFQIFNSFENRKVNVIKCVHLLLLAGVVRLKVVESSDDLKIQIRKLQNLDSYLGKVSDLEAFAIMKRLTGGSEKSPNFIWKKLSKLMGEPPQPSNKELFDLYKKIEQRVEKVRQSISRGDSTEIQSQLRAQEAEKMFLLTKLTEEAKQKLALSSFSEAKNILLKVKDLNPQFPRFQLLQTWAHFGAGDYKEPKKLEAQLQLIPQEEQLEAVFYYLQAQLYKMQGRFAESKTLFEKALQIDSQFLPARRELAQFSHKDVKKDVLNQDLKSLVSGFFKKTK